MTQVKRKRQVAGSMLSENEKNVLAAAKSLADEQGYPPSLREICNLTGLSIGGVHKIIARLQSLGRVTRNPGVERSLIVVSGRKRRGLSTTN